MAEATKSTLKDKASGKEEIHWFVDVILAMPTKEGAPFTKKRVPFPSPAAAYEALQGLAQELNDLEERGEDDDDEEGDEELDDIPETDLA